jgi:hypothetical protein
MTNTSHSTQQGTSVKQNISPEKAPQRSKDAASTRERENPGSFSDTGKKGADARHNKSEEESELARKSAATRQQQNPDASREMGEKGGRNKSTSSQQSKEEE